MEKQPVKKEDPTPKMAAAPLEVQLICHGMMLFWYRPPSAAGAKDDGYTILIPQLHPHEKVPHIFKMSKSPGGANPVLQYPNQPEGTRHLKLSFGWSESPKRRGAKSHIHNLSFYRNLEYAARPNFGETEAAGIAFAIDIPYPHREEPVLGFKYDNPPFVTLGKAQAAFDIRPRRILGASVFTFLNVDTGVDIKLEDKDSAEQIEIMSAPVLPIVPRVKIYIYSQPAEKRSGPTNHVHMLNGLLRLENLAGLDDPYDEEKLDLLVNPFRKEKPLPIKRPAGLEDEDILPLSSFAQPPDPVSPTPGQHKPDHGPIPSHGSDKKSDKGKAMEATITSFDPVECGQGGGCDFDCEEEECP